MIVLKFGGSCLDNVSNIRAMVKVVKAAEKNQPIIVLSAFKGITDELINQANSACKGNFDIRTIQAKHREVLRGLSASVRPSTEARTDELLEELHTRLTSVSYHKELNPEILDRIVSFGERLAVNTVSGYLSEAHLENKPMSDIEAGILTDSHFGNALILEESRELVRNKLVGTETPVIAGFFGKDKSGRIATLGRGGSDYVAAFIASALSCDCALIKDVDGIFNADPKIVTKAELIPRMDYQMALELAHYGSKVIFEKAIVPAMRARIPIRVSGLKNPYRGTLITNRGEAKAASYVKNVAVVNVLEIPETNIAYSIIHEFGTAYPGDLLLTGTYGNEISVITREGQSVKLCAIAKKLGDRIKLRVRKGLSLVAIIGGRFDSTQVHEILQRSKIRTEAVFTRPSGTSIYSIVEQKDTERAVGALHHSLIASER